MQVQLKSRGLRGDGKTSEFFAKQYSEAWMAPGIGREPKSARFTSY